MNDLFRWLRLPPWFVGKAIVFALAVLIITQFIVFITLSQRNNTAEFHVNRDIIARQVINLIQTIENTPDEQQNQVVDALNIPNFNVSINTTAKWHKRFVNQSLWNILLVISEQKPSIQLSFLLSPERWLNIEADIEPSSWHYQLAFLLLDLLLTGVIIFSLWTINRFTIPLHHFAEAAERLGVDLQAEPLPIIGPMAAKSTAQAINRMQSRLNDLLASRTQMLAAISHDLRTPITRLKLRLQYLEDEHLIKKMHNDLDQMETMIAETLAFAHGDTRKEQRSNLDLASLLASICDDYTEAKQAVCYDGTRERVPYTGGAVALRRMFSNIIENAIKYGNKAEVNLNILENDLVVTVCDEGSGIPTHLLEQVFLPFYRAENSRSRDTGGIGLGLAVARDIARAHGGDIILSNRALRGINVTITLPRPR